MRRHALVVLLLGLGLLACSDDGGDHQTVPDAGADGGTGPSETFCEELPTSTTATCDVTPGGATQLIKGNILTPETIFHGGQVAIDASGQITCVGCDCAQGGETVLSCAGASVSPGLINAHDHITFTQNDPYTQNPAIRYEHRHQWRKGQDGKPKIPAPGGASTSQISWGELRFVMGGATSIVGSGGASGLLRNLDIATQQEGLNHTAVDFETFPLGDNGGTRRTADCNYGTVITPESLDGVNAFEPHTAEGIDLTANNEFRCESSDTYDTTAPGLSEDLLLSKTAMIHAIGLTAGDYGAMAARGTALIWSPRSNVTLYGDTARVTEAATLGVEIALSTDWMPTGSMNLLRELKCASDLNETYFNHYFSDSDLWRMVTLNAAAVTATDDAIGLLAPNHVADIAIFTAGAGRNGYRAVVDSQPKDVALVLRGGVPLYGDAATVAALDSTCDTIDVCGVSKRVCTERELGKSYSELVSAVGDIYPAFACGEPDNEPSCVPSRPTAVSGSTIYSGTPSSTDGDGDGIADASDNCPSVFNPIRPMDNGVQTDIDSDGAGDACDPCPGDANTTTCTQIDPNDRDHDGLPNTADNCPDTANPGQTDGDGDGKGDACDACPSNPNPGTAGCPESVYRIKEGMVPNGTVVQIEDALVTGKGTNGFFVQRVDGDDDYAGADYSGLFVFTGPMTPALANAVVGMRVTIDGSVATFQGQLELDTVSAVTPTTVTMESAPTPVDVTYTDIKTGGPRAAKLESVIVSVDAPASVTAIDTTYGEYTLTASATTLVVDDFLYSTPNVTTGMQITGITGILAFRQMASKLEPRKAADIAQGPPQLASIGPALSYVRVNQTGVNTFPTGSELTVTLTGPAQGNTTVDLSSNSAALTVNDVVVPDGQSSVTVPVSTGASTASSVTVTAQLGSGTPKTANVRVLGATEQPTTVTLSPSTATVTPAGMVTLTATLDIPAPPGGTPVTLSVTPSLAGDVTALTIAANALSGTFIYTDATGDASTVKATVGSSMSSTQITVMAGANNLVINEVDYDQIMTDDAEYIEIYNPTGSPIDLSTVALVLINGSSSPSPAYPKADSIIDLSTVGSLPAGGYLVVAGANIAVPSPSIKLDPGWTSDEVQNGAPDGIALVDTATHTLIDSLSYEGSVTMAEVPGIANPVSLVEGTVLSNAVVDSNTAPGALCRSPNGKDTDSANADWKFCTTLSPGSANP
jgi:hypothetical protein